MRSGGAEKTAAPPADGAYPSKTIRYIVPYPPGAFNDTLARIVSAHLGDVLGQQVAGIALLVDVADRHPGGVAQAPEGRLDPLAHQTVGLALRLEHLGPDIGGTLAEAHQQERRRRHVQADQLGVELLRQPAGAFDARVELRIVEQLEKYRAIGHRPLPGAQHRPSPGRLMADA